MNPRSLSSVGILLIALLAGCSVAPLTPTSTVTEDQGVVVLRLTTNVAPTGFEASYQTLSVTSDQGYVLELRRTRLGVVRTGVFTGALPPGRYRINRFETIGYAVTRYVTVPAGFGTFTIKPGHLTDLGTLVYQPAGAGKVLFARGRVDSDARELMTVEFPQVATAVLSRPVLGWDDPPDSQQAQIFHAIQGRVAPFNAPRVEPSGAVYAGSALGQILWRPAGQTQWRQVDTGTLREILSVIEDTGGIVAAGEEGFLARSVDGGATWQRVPAPDRGAIVHLTRPASGGMVAVSSIGDAFTVWQAVADRWESRGRVPVERSMNISSPIPIVVSTDRQLMVAMPNGTIHALDLVSGSWARHAAPFSVISLAATGDGMVYAYGTTFLQSIWFSVDGGKTWTDLNTSRRAGAPAFTDRQTGYVLYVKEIYGGAISVQTTGDGGRTWTETGVLPETAARSLVTLFRPIVIHPSGPTLLLLANNGAVYSSLDRGATWREERRGAF